MTRPRWRKLLAPLAWPYAALLHLRNAAYDFGTLRTHAAALPVISIGNLTTGGTGKTPLTMWACRHLLGWGRRPAILMRGYAAAAGQTADEVLEYQLALPGVPVVVDADRVRGAARATREFGSDCVVLDDGFQHRRLHRNLDIVLIDALDPFGGGRMLPAGSLREPCSSLRRASVIVITRTNQVDPTALIGLRRDLARLAGHCPVVTAKIEPGDLTFADGESVPAVNRTDLHVLPVSAIGNPASFEQIVGRMFQRIATPMRYADHHRYTPADVQRIVSDARRCGATVVLTTRKDWVKLAPLWGRVAAAAGALRLARLDTTLVVDDPDAALDRALRTALEARP